MPTTQIGGKLIRDGTIGRDDLKTAPTDGQAVIAKATPAVSGSLTSTFSGGTAGTGDVVFDIFAGSVQASEALAAGDCVNVYDDGSGNFRVRRADASAANKFPCNGYVNVNVLSGAGAPVYSFGKNSGCTGLPPGDLYLSATTPGKVVTSATALAYSGSQLIQRVGVALSTTAFVFSPGLILETL